MSEEKADSERNEKSLQSLFGDGAVVLPADKYTEGYQLFAILSGIGVNIFDRVYAKTLEVFGKNFEGFRGTEMSFLVGFGSWGPEGIDAGKFKVEVQIEDRFYGGPYNKFLIFRLFVNLDNSGNNQWTEVERLESSEHKSHWDKFLKLKEALLAELSK